MIGTLLVLIQLMFPNDLSPMETHDPFIIISFGALCMTTSASTILFYTMNDVLSPAYDKILYGAFWVSVILSYLSLVIVILIPEELEWAGYTMLFVLFLAMAWLYLKGLKRQPDKKYTDNLEALEMV
ncbi:hypothetical protein L1887_06475 [Cichorium endivia]|nr:hypothetical protein L1887_06475 [Cichorium endivia]